MHFTRRLTVRLTHPTLSGLWYAFLWMMIGALVLSLLLHFSLLEESQLPWCTYVVHSISIVMGGIVSGKRARQKGWYQGALTGLLYGILLLLISFLALDTSLTLSDLALLIPTFVLGALGGVIGVNVSGK
ncbi:putative membrane protein (TIGR04086 family) [Paenibacillus anaericanus]|uniref:TIGR04086 family membrane protein n=1 Tax=Paenibacillus anaericanus TaxID=170367 RepID=A0A3S1EDJ2_9BACL|nr:TIGR04086 family membrane protein [Paenibacillus anaericanus]MDQ0090011.1 putative membrane protein (TIGR04086 family) [Paenibacillus anaericanus]RUT43305.1 TIGR04086 family membrane protein [Paenibacillus anaericanus]